MYAKATGKEQTVKTFFCSVRCTKFMRCVLIMSERSFVCCGSNSADYKLNRYRPMSSVRTYRNISETHIVSATDEGDISRC